MNKSFDKLISMQNYVTYLSLHDSSKPEKTGFNEAKKIALWSKKGKTLVSSEMFENFINNVQFDLVECPYDEQNTMIESKKFIRKMFDRTKHFVDYFYNEENNRIKVFNSQESIIFFLY